MKYIMSIDQGTTSSRAVIFNSAAEVVSVAQREFTQIYPRSGYVEHDPDEIFSTQVGVCREAVQQAGLDIADIAAIGITNQRETTIVWDRRTGRPVYNAIVWQCRRTAPLCKELEERVLGEMIREKTGLLIDPYFSAGKIKWILDNVNGARERAERGELLFGTVDCWLMWKLSGGKAHVTDISNASRTMLFNIHTLDWDDELLKLFGVPRCMLPEVVSSSGHICETAPEIFGRSIPVTGCAGDQQSALFGQRCFDKGDVKNTYGTGAFLLINTGDKPAVSSSGLLTTVAWRIGESTTYALEGSVFIAGAVIKWLRDELGIIATAAETEWLAKSVPDNGGVYLVPAFVGLGAPYWDSGARGTITGLTRGSGKRHIARAALESIAYQTCDVLAAMEKDTGKLGSVKADGGASANNFLMQFQADVAAREILRPRNVESTALGACFLAGLGCGLFADMDGIRKLGGAPEAFTPAMTEEERSALLDGWHDAVKRTMTGGCR
ncbi:MAG: glycerol kinase GlpK [Ruminiclostridium sp.]|nr:glycerol kinase GlpK [Ruminiclostridium sp.]